MKKSLFTAPVIVGQLALVALFVQGCTTYTPGRTALGSPSTELPSGTVVKLDEQSPRSPVTTVSPRTMPVTPAVPFTKFVIPEGKPTPVPHDGLKKTAIRHVPAPAPSIEVDASPAPLSPDGKYAIYVVKRGDTASQIANRHGLTRAEFTRINSLANPDRILVGQKLKVPTGGKPLAAGPATSTPSAEEGIHIVASGETLSEIAQKYSMRTADLVALNGITNPNVVRVGQKIKVSKTSASVKAPAEKKIAPALTPTAPVTKPVETPPAESKATEDPMEALLGLSPDTPAATTPSAAPTVGAAPSAPAAAKAIALKEHTVREGEDIFSISIDYGIRPMDIRRENNMTGSSLTPGSVIKIPHSDSSN